MPTLPIKNKTNSNKHVMTLNSLNTRNGNGGVEWARSDGQIILHVIYKMIYFCLVKAVRVWAKLLNHCFTCITLSD